MTIILTEQPAPGRMHVTFSQQVCGARRRVRAQTRSKLKTQTAANEIVSRDPASLFDAKTEPFP